VWTRGGCGIRTCTFSTVVVEDGPLPPLDRSQHFAHQVPQLPLGRPKADLQLLIIMLRLQPALPPFAVAEKSGDWRIHTVWMGWMAPASIGVAMRHSAAAMNCL